MNSDRKDEMGVAGIIGFQRPLDDDDRKEEAMLRAVIREKIREIVRKKPGTELYVLYSPNLKTRKVGGKRKKGKPNKVGEFPTRAAAKRAELSRFPPHDPEKLKQKRKEVEKLRKAPGSASVRKAPAKSQKKAKAIPKQVRTKREFLARLTKMISESIFREEGSKSQWDDYVSKISKQAVVSDKKLQNLQKLVAKKSEQVLQSAFSSLKKALSKNGFSVKGKGQLRKDSDKGDIFTEFAVGDSEGTTEIGPLFIRIVDGRPDIGVSSNAKASMTTMDPERGKLLRSELTAIQEDMLDADDSVRDAIAKRDAYLTKLEKTIDETLADMSGLEISMLKNLLVKKYRQMT